MRTDKKQNVVMVHDPKKGPAPIGFTNIDDAEEYIRNHSSAYTLRVRNERDGEWYSAI